MFDVHCFSALTLYDIHEQKLGSHWRLHVCVCMCAGDQIVLISLFFGDIIEKFCVFLIVLFCVPSCCSINYAI
jgi:hypothetical protein